MLAQPNNLWRERYSFCDDNALHLQCTPTKHTCLTSLHLSFFSFSLKANSSKSFTDVHKTLHKCSIMPNFPVDHRKQRPYQGSIATGPFLHCSSSIHYWQTWNSEAFTVTYQAIFTIFMSLHQTPRSTFKTTVNFHSFPVLELHSLVAVWRDPCSERVGKTCLHTARTCTSTVRKILIRNIRFNQHSLRTEYSDYSFNLKTGCFEHQSYTAWETVGTAT